MNSYLNIAVASEDAEEVIAHLDGTLGLDFEPHESSYKGIYWLHTGVKGANIEVGYNEDPMYQEGDPPDERYFEAAFKDFWILLRATAPIEGLAAIKNAIELKYPGSQVIPGRDAQPGVQADRP